MAGTNAGEAAALHKLQRRLRARMQQARDDSDRGEGDGNQPAKKDPKVREQDDVHMLK